MEQNLPVSSAPREVALQEQLLRRIEFFHDLEARVLAAEHTAIVEVVRGFAARAEA